MANIFSPEELGVQAPKEGFEEGGWYQGRQFIGGTLSEPGVIHPSSSQIGAGQLVSAEVNVQSAAQQGVSPEQLEAYLEQQRQQAAYAGTGQAVGAGEGAGAGFAPPATINLPDLYKGLYEGAGISALEAEYSQMEKEYIEAKAKIDDNPFLSEASRVGRIAKIEKLFAERTANIQGDIATKKADVEMQMNLQIQQFNIESQAAQQALSQFNTLLDMGALDNASGETIASLTRTTGISSDMIYSAIQANKAKNTKVSVTPWSDGTNDYFVAYDQYGNIVNRQLIGASGKGAAGTTKQSAVSDVQAGMTAQDLAKKYGGSLDDWELMNIYDQNSIYGPMTESPEQFREWTTGGEAKTTQWEAKRAVQQEVHNAVTMGASNEEIENYIRSQGFDPYDFDY